MNVIEAIERARPKDSIYRRINPGYKYTLPDRPIEVSLGGSTHIFLDLFVGNGAPEQRVFDFWILAKDWEIERATRNRRR